MKVGDLVIRHHDRSKKIGVIVFFKSFEHGKNPQPIVMIDDKIMLIGAHECEVISEAG